MSNKQPMKRQVKVAQTIPRPTPRRVPIKIVDEPQSKKSKSLARNILSVAAHTLGGAYPGLPQLVDLAAERYFDVDPKLDPVLVGRRGVAQTKRRAEFNSGGNAGLSYSSLPVRVESAIGPFFLRRAGKAQRLTADSGPSDPQDSVRYEFSDMIPYTVATDATPHVQQVLKTGASYLGAIAITPGDMSPKLAVLETLYDKYCFRELRFSYIPTVGTGSAGTLGICVSAEPIEDTTLSAAGITLNQVLEHSCSKAVTINMPMTLNYTCHGTRLYVTTATGTPPIQEYAQAYLFASSTGTVASVSYGNIIVSGVLDLYSSSEINVSPVLQEELLWKRFCFREWWNYYHSPHYDGIKPDEFYRRYCGQIRVRESRKLIRTPSEPIAYSVEETKRT